MRDDNDETFMERAEMDRIRISSVPRQLMLGVLCILVTASAASAAPIAALTYTEADLGGGRFRYDFVLRSLADPAADPEKSAVFERTGQADRCLRGGA